MLLQKLQATQTKENEQKNMIQKLKLIHQIKMYLEFFNLEKQDNCYSLSYLTVFCISKTPQNQRFIGTVFKIPKLNIRLTMICLNFGNRHTKSKIKFEEDLINIYKIYQSFCGVNLKNFLPSQVLYLQPILWTIYTYLILGKQQLMIRDRKFWLLAYPYKVQACSNLICYTTLILFGQFLQEVCQIDWWNSIYILYLRQILISFPENYLGFYLFYSFIYIFSDISFLFIENFLVEDYKKLQYQKLKLRLKKQKPRMTLFYAFIPQLFPKLIEKISNAEVSKSIGFQEVLYRFQPQVN
ncbi:unnamed protein product [Paramecium octaurelia]|uniref:Transmembrane protein n=1 Tax=Paramecium octaurelia TaxID=43137 RepID=A0A8S1WBG0_PAROT|nr:unnamed protein product [Paramecium octaurelia]